MVENIKGIYIELDSLFDTRLGIIAELGEKYVEQALNENYINRKRDSFSFISDENFKKLYELRDTKTLSLSPICSVQNLLVETCRKLVHVSLDSPEATGIKIFVNCYPFKLSDQEAGDILDLVVNITKAIAQVELIYKSPEQLTVDYCDEFFDILFIYDYNNFLETNVKNGQFKKKNMTDKILIGPELHLYKEITESDLQEIYRRFPVVKGYKLDKALKIMASPVICLEVIEPSVFSVDLDFYKSKQQS
jgi:hypothetical protein